MFPNHTPLQANRKPPPGGIWDILGHHPVISSLAAQAQGLTQSPTLNFGFWALGFIWDLVLGIWTLKPSSLIRHSNFVIRH